MRGGSRRGTIGRLTMTDSPRRPSPGLYDEPVTLGRDAEISRIGAELVQLGELDDHHAPVAIGRVLYTRIVSALASLPSENKTAEQIALANHLLDALREHAPKNVLEGR